MTANLGVEQIRWFECRRRTIDVNELLLFAALRNEWVRQRFPLGATVFGWPELCTWLRATAKDRGFELPELAVEPPPRIPIELQFEALHTTNAYPTHPDAMRSRIGLPELLRGGRRIRRSRRCEAGIRNASKRRFPRIRRRAE